MKIDFLCVIFVIGMPIIALGMDNRSLLAPQKKKESFITKIYRKKKETKDSSLVVIETIEELRMYKEVIKRDLEQAKNGAGLHVAIDPNLIALIIEQNKTKGKTLLNNDIYSALEYAKKNDISTYSNLIDLLLQTVKQEQDVTSS